MKARWLQKLILFPLQQALNAYLQLEPACLAPLAHWQQQVLAIEPTGLVPIYLTFMAEGLAINLMAPKPALATIKGSPLALVQMLQTERAQALLAQQVISIEGELAMAQALQRVFKQVDVDWEELLAKALGDVLAHSICRQLAQWGVNLKQCWQESQAQLVDYLQEEFRALPTAAEVEHFYQQVSQLRNDSERLQARINRLSQPLQSYPHD